MKTYKRNQEEELKLLLARRALEIFMKYYRDTNGFDVKKTLNQMYHILQHSAIKITNEQRVDQADAMFFINLLLENINELGIVRIKPWRIMTMDQLN